MKDPFHWVGDRVEVSPQGPVNVTASVPGSKSLTNRYLLLASLADGVSHIKRPLHSEDTTLMAAALSACGVSVEQHESEMKVTGTGKLQQPRTALYVGNAGTVMRFLTPALAAFPIKVHLQGSSRMALRPIADLADALAELGVQIRFPENHGYPPLEIEGPIAKQAVKVRGDRSSQYLSGLLMALPMVGGGRVRLSSELVSQSYVKMTLVCMQTFGIEVDATADEFVVPAGPYTACDVTVESDLSTASYWFALPFMLGGQVKVCHVDRHSTQGDLGLVNALQEMGAEVSWSQDSLRIAAERPLSGIDIDMNTMSDVAPTLMAVATRASSPTTIRGIGHMRIKECDRIQTMQTAFDALGLRMASGPDWVRVYPGHVQNAAVLDPEDDHRMAMVFALLGLADGMVTIKNARCVEKTYPTFYTDFEAALNEKSQLFL